MRQTSIDVYNQIKEEGLLSKLRLVVYSAIYRAGPMTAQETWHYLRDDAARSGQARINGITPRFSELEVRGVITSVGIRSCKITGRKCTVWDVTSKLPLEPIKKETNKQKISRLEARVKELENQACPCGQWRFL